MPRKYAMWIIGIGSAIVVLLVVVIVIIATDGGEVAAVATSEVAATVESTPPTEAPGTTATTAVPATDPTTTTSTITTAAPATTTTATTVPPGPGCVDAGPIPASATNRTDRQGDFDGDGSLDDFTAYQMGSNWYLWARLSNGDYRLVTPIDLPWSFAHWNGTVPGPLNLQGARTLGDPRQAMSVEIYQGLGSNFALFAVEDCEIVAFTDAGGTIPPLWRAMGPAHTDFPVCREPDAVVQQAVLSCGGDVSTCPNLDATVTPYTLSRDPARIVPDGGGSWTLNVSQAQYQTMVAQSCLG